MRYGSATARAGPATDGSATGGARARTGAAVGVDRDANVRWRADAFADVGASDADAGRGARARPLPSVIRAPSRRLAEGSRSSPRRFRSSMERAARRQLQNREGRQ